MAASSALLASSLPSWASLETASSCVLTPELTSGPYFVDYELIRKDIREHKPGIPLHLRIAVVNAKTCRPIENAGLDIWHCDTGGIYSGYTKYSPDSMEAFTHIPAPTKENPAPRLEHSDNETFFRGVQLTDKRGAAEFLTIYPGWYVTRDTHIHVSVHVGGHTAKSYVGGHICHVGQIAFPDEIGDRVAKLQPYAQHKARRTRLEEDTVFKVPVGKDMMLQLEQLDAANLSAGFRGTITMAVDPEATPAPLPAGPPIAG